jgi:hypothetical protein
VLCAIHEVFHVPQLQKCHLEMVDIPLRDTICQHPDFYVRMPIISFIAIPGILLLLDIIAKYHSHDLLQLIKSYNLNHMIHITRIVDLLITKQTQVQSGSIKIKGLSSPQANA